MDRKFACTWRKRNEIQYLFHEKLAFTHVCFRENWSLDHLLIVFKTLLHVAPRDSIGNRSFLIFLRVSGNDFNRLKAKLCMHSIKDKKRTLNESQPFENERTGFSTPKPHWKINKVSWVLVEDQKSKQHDIFFDFMYSTSFAGWKDLLCKQRVSMETTEKFCDEGLMTVCFLQKSRFDEIKNCFPIRKNFFPPPQW